MKDLQKDLQIENGVLVHCMNESIQKVKIPEGVTEIATDAFCGYTCIKSVVIPKTVRRIGRFAFANCSSLENVKIANGLQRLDDYCFSGCSKLKEIKLPKSVRFIGVGTFKCSGLESVTMRNGITKISESTFYLCSNLKNVKIPKSVQEICCSAFLGCFSLTSINIPEGVFHISEYSFSGSGLVSVNLPKSLIIIGIGAFEDCKYLKEVNIKDGVVISIYSRAFRNCPISKIKLPKTKIDYVGIEAFNFQKSIKSIKNFHKVKAYKAFCKNYHHYKSDTYDLVCRDFCYTEGMTYTTPVAKLCHYGFHACLNPFDVFNHYYGSLKLEIEVHEVTLEGLSGEMDGEDSKVCGTKITIGRKLSISDIVEIFNKQVENNLFMM